TIELEYQVTTHGKPFLSGFESFQTFDDLDKKTVRLTAPADVAVQTFVSGANGIVKQETNSVGGAQVFQWQAHDVKALPLEGQLPPEWFYMAGVQYFAGNLKKYLTDLNDTLLNRSRQSTKAADKAHQLASQATSKKDAVKSIRDFVAKSIRLA